MSLCADHEIALPGHTAQDVHHSRTTPARVSLLVRSTKQVTWLFHMPLPRGLGGGNCGERVEQDETESFGDGPNTS
jgi:hypothetical protein